MKNLLDNSDNIMLKHSLVLFSVLSLDLIMRQAEAVAALKQFIKALTSNQPFAFSLLLCRFVSLLNHI